MARHVALIRGVNVGATRKLPMADLRAALTETGFANVATYIQSGNVVLDGEDVEAQMEALIGRRFGLDVPVIARDAADWRTLAADCPYPERAATDPNLVLVGLAKRPADPDGVAELARRMPAVEVAPWHGGVAFCWLSREAMRETLFAPAQLDRLAGSPVTTRNWRTVTVLAGMVEAPAPT